MPSVFIKTYGCQMNERDSEAVAAQLSARGYALAKSEQQADVILLNTCSVRDQAEQKALGKMAHLAGKTRRRGAVLGFMGCMAQNRGQSLIDKLPDVDLVLGTQKFHRAGDYLDQILAGERGQICDTEEERGSESTIREHLAAGQTTNRQPTAYVSIMQGCNQHCAFCIVPRTRGRERSRSIQDIVEECQELAAANAKEITLLGQIVTSYGKREIGVKNGKSAFVQLLEAIHQVSGIQRIRFTSPHPKGYGDDLIEAYRSLPKLCASAHVPVQSGSNRILKRMRRGYTRERFLEIIRKLRQAQPDIGITTDIIVAFPGETETDFQETLSLAEEAQFDNAFVFKYSPRQDTPAADMEEQIPREINERRHAQLLEKISQIGSQKYQRFIGKTAPILVEGPSRRNPNRLQGRTSCNKIVVFEGDNRHIGKMLDLNIYRAGLFTLYGLPATGQPA